MDFLWGIKKEPFRKLADYSDMQVIQKKYEIILQELHTNKTWLNWGSDNCDASGKCYFLDGAWTICPVYFGNYSHDMMKVHGLDKEQVDEIVKALPSKFPKTQALLKPFEQINFAAFSKLHAHSKLDPHRHQNPYSLIFHLGLIVPKGEKCGLKVNGLTHLWSAAGDAVIFDDNFEHSAWNDSDEDRIVFYIDFRRFAS